MSHPRATHDRLDSDRIGERLGTRRIGRKVLVYEQTASTNHIASEYARNRENDGLAVFAEEQTAGRGRTGAQWQSPYGESLLFSVLLIDCALGNELLSLTCAVAVAEALGDVGGQRVGIKWPNDILLVGRKVCGILVESRRVVRCASCVVRPSESLGNPSRATSDEIQDTTVIGIGINCHQTVESFPPELRDVATSLDLVAGNRCDRITLARRTLASLDQWLQAAEKSKKRVIETWSNLSTQLAQRVTLSYNGRTFTGHCIGIDPVNGLILQLDRGGVRMFDAAHTTILK
jgi:BirA family biotin operon repressor/biotin-[acetyl-CoA-carboxylase] ligase